MPEKLMSLVGTTVALMAPCVKLVPAFWAGARPGESPSPPHGPPGPTSCYRSDTTEQNRHSPSLPSATVQSVPERARCLG